MTIAIGLCVGLAAGWFLIMSSAWGDRATQQQRLADVAARADDLQMSADEQDNLRAALPAQVDRADLQMTIEAAARAAKVYPTSISVTGTPRGPRAATIRVSALGTPTGVTKMLRALTGSLAMREGTDYAYATSRAPVLVLDGLDIRSLPGANRIQVTLTLGAQRFVAPSR